MMKKTKSTNLLFATTILLGLLLHAYFLFVVPFSYDESFYASIPFRLVNGDSLIQHEWHLSQFSSLFSYMPVWIWTTIKGSADSLFLFLRCVYLVIHTSVAIGIYAFFKERKKWAVIASMIFFIQIPYRILAISYHSMFAIFMLLLSLCLLSIYKKDSTRSYILAGVCFACCCVCNPLFSLVFALYLIICILWTKRDSFKGLAFKLKNASKKSEKLTKKQKRQQSQAMLDAFPNLETYNCFFNKKAILWFSCGILIMAVVAIIFFFLTGGTITSIINNLENLLGSSEYDVTSSPILAKLAETLNYFSMATLGMPWILPALFILLFIDRRKQNNSHRLFYLFVAIVWSAIFIFGVLAQAEVYLCAISLPFYIISAVCYLLTRNRNKTLFYFMFVPCSIAAFFQYLAAETHLAAIGIGLAICNVAGVFFAMDLCKEMRFDSNQILEAKAGKVFSILCRGLIILGLTLQLLFFGTFYFYGQIMGKDAVKATTGPYSGLYIDEYRYTQYSETISDMDYIKAISKSDDPVLIASYNNWMYTYLERPIATYTTWYRGSLDSNQLIRYYKENPKKTPKYIYIESANPDSTTVESITNIMSEMFTFTKKELSNGVLLIVEYSYF